MLQIDEQALHAACVSDVCAVGHNSDLMRAQACNALFCMAEMCENQGAKPGDYQSVTTCSKD